MPEIPVGDAVRKLNLPGWLRWILSLVKGVRIKKGDTVIVLDEDFSVTPPRTGLDQPARVEPPKIAGPR